MCSCSHLTSHRIGLVEPIALIKGHVIDDLLFLVTLRFHFTHSPACLHSARTAFLEFSSGSKVTEWREAVFGRLLEAYPCKAQSKHTHFTGSHGDRISDFSSNFDLANSISLLCRLPFRCNDSYVVMMSRLPSYGPMCSSPCISNSQAYPNTLAKPHQSAQGPVDFASYSMSASPSLPGLSGSLSRGRFGDGISSASFIPTSSSSSRALFGLAGLLGLAEVLPKFIEARSSQ